MARWVARCRRARGWTLGVGTVTLASLSACSSPDLGVIEPGGTQTGDTEVFGDASTTTTTTTTTGAEPPVIIDAAQVVAPGGHVWLLVDAPIGQIQVDVDGRSLGSPVTSLFTDEAGGMWRIPTDLAPGPAQLGVSLRDEPGARAPWALDVVTPLFVDVAAEVGLDQEHDATGSPMECAYSHTGVAVGDYDGDGDPDLYVGNVGSQGRLFQNRGDIDGDGLPDFRDVTEQAGLAGVNAVAMATFVDLEGDGDQDLFVGRRGANRVFRNRLVEDGEAEFEDVTEQLGLGIEDQRTMGVAFGDYDGDDDLDLYVVNHAYCFPQKDSEIRARDHLYRNDDGVFVEVTELLQGKVLESVGFSAVWIDIERDGDQDLVVINDDVGGDIGLPNALWRNDGPGVEPGTWQFSDVSESSGVGLVESINGMGLALGDVNDDGFVDLAFSNIGANYLLVGNGDGTFLNVSDAAGIEREFLPWENKSITWATHLFDYDNDADLDLYFSGGRIKGFAPVPDALLENTGDVTFVERTWEGPTTDPASGKASALLDLDRDGRLDMVTTAWNGALRVHHNRAPDSVGNHYLVVALQGRGGNRDAVGAIVELRHGDGRTQTCFHTGRPSLGAGGETACHFGLGPAPNVDGLRIVWPDGTVQDVTPPGIDQRVQYVHPDAGW